MVDTSEQIYSYDELCEDLQELKRKYPEKLQLNVLATTADGREVQEAVFGNPEAKTQILIHAGIHAREYMTCMLVMNQLEFYLEYLEEGSYGGTTFAELFEQVGVHLVPMVNPDGISISQFGLEGITSASIRQQIEEWYDRDKTSGATSYSFKNYLKYWKANARGVDLNRNFDYGFEAYQGAAAPGAQKYKGTAAASEAEATALVRLTEKIQPALTISYHATGSVIYWDYGQTGELRTACKQMVDVIHSINDNEIKYAATDQQDAAGYGDWCVMVKQIPSATIEIGVGAAPMAISEYEAIWKRNAMIWAALAKYTTEQ
ncbi:MAG: peptidase M14 [Lachnospiraceae bacterium]|nr:peptidase M14 [Lachnospiraceae bacterium]